MDALSTTSAPYGMGDCRTFMDVPPLVHMPDGSVCINPDFEAVHSYRQSAVGRDPASPSDVSLKPVVTLGPNQSVDMQLTNDREENGVGHFLITELMIMPNPETAALLAIQIKNQSSDRVYTNAAVLHTLVLGDAQLNCCLPCPIMLYPNQTLVFNVQNIEAVDVQVRIVARGFRFLPYHDLSLKDELERCWSMLPSSPYWLTIDSLGVVVPAATAAGPGRAQTQMTVPGGGWLEIQKPRCKVLAGGPGVVTPDDIEVLVTDGRVGKQFMDGFVRLGAHYATPTIQVAGFPGGIFRAASACSTCADPPQLIRGNTRMVHTFLNFSTTPAIVFLVYPACMHDVDRCPPAGDLDLVRRFGISDAGAMRRAIDSGERIVEAFMESNPLYAEYQCPQPAGAPCPAPAAPPAPRYEPVYEELPPPPAEPIIGNTWRPSGNYYGPGSTGQLPGHLSYGSDQYGRTHLVKIEDGRLKIADLSEGPPWAATYVNDKNRQAGLSGLGRSPQGEWERI